MIHEAHPYLVISAIVHVSAWSGAYWILGSEYKRYQPLTWIGLRGFWFLVGLEGCARLSWVIMAPIDISPDYLVDYPGISAILILLLSSLEIWSCIVAILIPTDLNQNLSSHIQRLLLEHPSANDASPHTHHPSIPHAYTLHEEDVCDRYQNRRADAPGWIYSVEEELPFEPKIDIIDVHVVAINQERRTIKTVYRIQVRVTTTSLVVEFNAHRRYKELRFLDDQLRAVFDHSRYPEQRASMGSFPPRELTQADPFARQIALREYLRRLSESPIFYVQEFLDMVGIDPKFDSGRLYEQCLDLQAGEMCKLPIRRMRSDRFILKQPQQPQQQAPAAGLTHEPIPWRPPQLVVPATSSSDIQQTPPPPMSPSLRLSVTIPDCSQSSKKIIYYRIVTETNFGTFESKHRFSDFQRLSVHLRDFLNIRPSISLPSRLVRGFSQTHAQFLSERREMLEIFLRTLLSEFPSIVSSRFVRSFFKLPADPLMLSAIANDSANMMTPTEIATISRGTPTYSELDTQGSPAPTLVNVSPSLIETPRLAAELVIEIPFFCNHEFTSVISSSSSTSPSGLMTGGSSGGNVFTFCLRIKSRKTHSDWTRFHTFDEFIKLKNSLASINPTLIEGIADFPPRRGFWLSPSDIPGIKVENEGRKRVLERWINEVVSRCEFPLNTSCMQLYDFLSSDDQGSTD